MSFYSNFVKLCELHGVAPSVVVREIGLNNSSATYWKRGSIPKHSTIIKLANYFNVDWTELLPQEEQTADTVNRIKENWNTIHGSTLTYKQQCEIHEVNSRNRLEAAYAQLNLVGHQKVADYAEKLARNSSLLVDPESPYYKIKDTAPRPDVPEPISDGTDTTTEEKPLETP